VNTLRQFAKILPTLGLSFALAIAVWISAVSEADPTQRDVLPSQVPVEIIGQDPGLILSEDISQQVTVTITAPQSVWTRLLSEPGLITATVDLSGLGPGEHTVDIQVTISPRVRAARVVGHSPETLTLTLEKLATRTFPIQLVREGEPAIGFQVEQPSLNQDRVVVSGPESRVSQIKEVRASLNLSNAHEDISTSLSLTPVNENEEVIERVSLNPERVQVTQPITQRGGFRSDLVVKPVYQGRIAEGYRLTNISVFPPAVTVFSADPQKVDQLPGFVETLPINLDGARDDIEERVALNLPEGVSLVSEQRVLVQVGIAAIESSLTLANQTVEIQGLGEGLAAHTSPETVDVILSGPLPLLDALVPGEVRLIVDVTGLEIGTHQIIPQVQLRDGQLRVESILPGTLEVEITIAPTPTPTPRP